jgi:hypothetical protein
MLSKLRHFSSPSPSLALPEPQPQDLQRHLGAPLSDIRPVTQGTLGACYTALLRGKPVFLKTHSLPEGRSALLREAKLLACAYPGMLSVRAIELSALDRGWLVCDRLEEPRLPLTVAAITGLIGRYQTRLGNSGDRLREESFIDFKELLAAGCEALDRLTARAVLPSDLTRWLSENLEALKAQTPRLPRILCHGDLGPRNILHAATEPVAIDWEDTFWGIQGYDQLYWLSFMENTVHLRAGWKQVTALDPDREQGLLGVIVLLKSHLAIASGAFRQHRVTAEERLREIASLPSPRPPDFTDRRPRPANGAPHALPERAGMAVPARS